MRTLGLDWGEARVGVALSDPTGVVAMPHGVIHEKNKGDQTRAVVELVRETGSQRIVVGLPLHMDGSRSPSTDEAERFAAKLEATTGLEVVRWDERWTSVAAERALREMGGRRKRGQGQRRHDHTKKGDVDRVAATLMLQAYLDSRVHRTQG